MCSLLQCIALVALIALTTRVQVTGALYLTPGSYAPCSYAPSNPVRILDCSNKGLSEVPGVDAAMAASVFYLDGNPIASIGPSAFGNLSASLKLLSVKSSAPMDRIDNAAFAGLTALTSLTVQGKENSETSMNKVNIASLLSGLRALTSLSMQSVNVNELPISFASATSLVDLSLIHTAIATIDPYAFSNASNLRSLDLSYNALNVATGKNMNWLGSAASLETGVFASCGITSAYLAQIPSLPKLKKLDLTANALDRLLASSLDNVAATLEELVLSNNGISESNTNGLAGLVALKKLTIGSDNQLSAIPPQVKQLQALELLDLRGTRVAGIEADSFHPTSRLRILKLDYTQVHSLHALAFAKLTSLEEFTLSASALASAAILDTAGALHTGNWSILLAQVPGLQTLSLGTGISSDSAGGLTNDIWDAVQKLPRLSRLNLMYNNITALPDFYLSAFANLTYVNLLGNSIDRVTSAAFYGLGGATLLLQNNRLSAMDNCTLAMFTNLTSVNLGGNPFNCNCAMRWLWLRVNSDSPISLPSMQCSQPAALAGRFWDTLRADSFCSPGEVPPNNCSVLVPSTVAPTTATFPYRLSITVSKASETSVSLTANVASLAGGQFAGYVVRYWPQARPQETLNTSLLTMTTSTIALQVRSNEVYRYCYVLVNRTNWLVENQANCRDYTLNAMASAAIIAIAVLAAIIGIALIFVAVCLLCKRMRHNAAMKAPPADEDPYTYTYPDEKQVGKASSSKNNSQQQFQATLRPESKRFSKRSRTNLAGSRPSLATSTTTLATSRFSSPGFAVQNGARPASGNSVMQQQQHQQQLHQNPLHLSGGGAGFRVQASRSMHNIVDDPAMNHQQLSRSQDQLSDAPGGGADARSGRGGSGRMLPAPPRQARSQELVLDVTQVPHHQQNQKPPLPPSRYRLPSASSTSLQVHHHQQPQHHAASQDYGVGSDGGAYVPMSSATAESSTDDGPPPQPPLSPNAYAAYNDNNYLPEDQLQEAMRHPATAQQQLTPSARRPAGGGGVDNSAFQRSEASGYYEMGHF